MTLVSILKAIPCFFRMRCMFLEISASMPGNTTSRNSTTVTLAPSLRQTEPNSSPITPAPITTISFGTFVRSNAPVDDTICFSSISTPGSGVT